MTAQEHNAFPNGRYTDLFSRMTHASDPPTSVAAAEAIEQHLSEVQRKIIEALKRQPMTDEELENNFHGYGPSTIRKRRSELYHQGKLETCGVRVNSRGHKMLVWRLA